MNRYKKRKMIKSLYENKLEYILIFTGIFVLLLSSGYALFNSTLSISGRTNINYKAKDTPEGKIPEDNCPYSSGTVSSQFIINSKTTGSPNIYNVTFIAENNSNEQISPYIIEFYGPSDLDIETSSYVDSYTVDNGYMIINPANWANTLRPNSNVYFDLHFITSEDDFNPTIKINGCSVKEGTSEYIGEQEDDLISLSFATQNIILNVNKNYSLVLNKNPQNADVTINWKSSDQNVATISNTGIITAVGVGQTTITATGGGKKTFCIVTVTNNEIIELTDLSIEEQNQIISIDETINLTLNKTPNNAQSNIIWMSSNTNIANVTSDGVVTGINGGTATITAASNEKIATTNITVDGTQSELSSISLNTNTLQMEIGETNTLFATKIPSIAPDIITWKSSNPSVATVNSNGIITAVGIGQTTITASSGSISASCIVNVNMQDFADNIVITYEPIGQWGTQLQFLITIKNNGTKDITYLRFYMNDIPENSTYSLWHGNEVTASGNTITYTNKIATNESIQIRGQINLPNGYDSLNFSDCDISVISIK